MSAVAKLKASKQAPLPLKAVNLFKDYPKTRLVTVHTTIIAGVTKTFTRNQELPFTPDGMDIEHICNKIYHFLMGVIK